MVQGVFYLRARLQVLRCDSDSFLDSFLWQDFDLTTLANQKLKKIYLMELISPMCGELILHSNKKRWANVVAFDKTKDQPALFYFSHPICSVS